MRKITLKELQEKGIDIIDSGNLYRNNISELLKKRGLLIIDLATLTCITKQNLGAIQKGKTKPSVVDALKIAKTLGVTVEEVFQLNEDKAWYIPYTEDDKQMYYDFQTECMYTSQEKRDILKEVLDPTEKRLRSTYFKRLGLNMYGQTYVIPEKRANKTN